MEQSMGTVQSNLQEHADNLSPEELDALELQIAEHLVDSLHEERQAWTAARNEFLARQHEVVVKHAEKLQAQEEVKEERKQLRAAAAMKAHRMRVMLTSME